MQKLNNFLYLIKKYGILFIIALIISIPLIHVCTTKTNYEFIVKGDTVKFNSIIEVEDAYKEEGSFSTVYVTSLEHSTIFQNWFQRFDKESDKVKMSKAEISYSSKESARISKIQYAQSVTNAIILAYTEAQKENDSINIDYEYMGYYFTYKVNDTNINIGDRLYGIKLKDSEDIIYYNNPEYPTIYKKSNVGDTYLIKKYKSIDDFNIITEDDYYEYVLTDKDFRKEESNGVIKTYRNYSYTECYDVKRESLKPSVNYNKTSTGGPSGGLMQALSIYNALTPKDITYGYKIAGTGTINIKGNVGAIGAVKQKIPTAIDNNIKIFLCPSKNYDDAYDAYMNNINRKRMKLYKIETFYDAIKCLKEFENE